MVRSSIKKVSAILLILFISYYGFSQEVMKLPTKWKFSITDSLVFSKPDYNDKRWKDIEVGQIWQKAGYKHNGFAWYRLSFQVPESLMKAIKKISFFKLTLGSVDDVAQIFLNGFLVEQYGNLPPHFRSAWGQKVIFLLKKEEINLNKDNQIAIRIFSPDTIGGGLYTGPYEFSVMDSSLASEFALQSIDNYFEYQRSYEKEQGISKIYLSNYSRLEFNGIFKIQLLDKNNKKVYTNEDPFTLNPFDKDHCFSFTHELKNDNDYTFVYNIEEKSTGNSKKYTYHHEYNFPDGNTLIKNSNSTLSAEVGKPRHILNSAGDTWISAWADNDTLYTPADDSRGFNNFCDRNVLFNKLLITDSIQVDGITANCMNDYGKAGETRNDTCTWKSSGCYMVDGVLYLVVARHNYGETSFDANLRQTAKNASIIKSYDRGNTWVRPESENYSNPMFKGGRFATPYFIEYGKNGVADIDNADKYVYAVSNNGFWDNGDNLILGRVLRSKIADLNNRDWQFYKGGNGMNDTSWNSESNQAKLIIDNPNKLGMNGMVYIPGLKKYIYIAWYYPAGGGKIRESCEKTIWDFYESDKPWGPFTRFGSYVSTPQGFYSPQICPKFSTPRGNINIVFTAGNWTNPEVYKLTVVPVQIKLK